MAYEKKVLRERYQIVAEIGRGGMSVTYLALDLNLGSYWAIKQIKNSSSVEFEAFLKEVELLASLNHSDIPRIVDRIECDDDYFVVMDFIGGTSLAKIVNLEGTQDETNVITWGIQIAQIMDYLHSSNLSIGKKPIIYRDLKPDNIMLTPAGNIKLIDFGIAEEYTPGNRLMGESLGTKGYAAPEQYKGASNILDARSDVYGLGATLYYLSTGFTPDIPPNGVPSVRSKNHKLSDAFEYVVAKCTADAPENRYKNFAEVKSDLENIEGLSELYRKKMKRRVIIFWLSLILSIVFAAVGWVGYRRVQADLENQFQAAYQQAAAYDRENDYLTAARSYTEALQAKPGDRETHVLLFNALLPHNGGEGAEEQTKAAIDEMRKGYLDNPESPMYNDPQLCYMAARRCVEVGDMEYANIAMDYIGIIKNSEDYQEGIVSIRELEAFEVIASFQLQDSTNADYDSFSQMLLNLEDYTEASDLTLDERIGNYYILIQMYNTYPSQLQDAYIRAYEIGTKAKTILDQNQSDDTMAFNNIVPMFEMIAVGQYNIAITFTSDTDRKQVYLNSIEWFGYLKDLNIELSENLYLKMANAYKGVFDMYNTPQLQDSIDESISSYLDASISVYESIIAKNENSFLAYVYLSNAYYDREMLRDQAERNFTQTSQAYSAARLLASSDDTISSTSLMQFSSLAKLLQNAGLEV